MNKIGITAGLLCALASFATQAAEKPRWTEERMWGPPPRDIADCRFASVGAGSRFIVAGVMDGDTLSNLQFGDPKEASTIVRVEVEAGSDPLTVVLHSESPVIWDFGGAVERIESAFIARRKGTREVASRGLPEGVAKFPDLDRCPTVIQPPWANVNNVQLYFGRAPDLIAFENKPKMLKLPTGEFATQERPDAATYAEREIYMYHPGGFRVLDAKSVVSALPVLEPETYPQEAGLFELVKTEAIREPERGEIDRLVEDFLRRHPSKSNDVSPHIHSVNYLITREITLPPAMYGGHLKRFLVLPGVPEPRGNVGHGCVIFIDGRATKNGGACLAGLLRSSPKRPRRSPLPAFPDAPELHRTASDEADSAAVTVLHGLFAAVDVEPKIHSDIRTLGACGGPETHQLLNAASDRGIKWR
ncbi:hypothetical protein [Bradyrhizobium elkanii]|uniref:hypothetical protein n=1 Tax=Bradyrhizobium elkanii TaxID=29448 RepID=UPI00114CFDBC|nr:hypothetical protein [Bradyrhizobium elkanii]